MTIVGDRKFVEVPGGKTHELPPLLVRTVPDVKRLDKMMGIASEIIEQEDMVPSMRNLVEIVIGEDEKIATERHRRGIAGEREHRVVDAVPVANEGIDEVEG